MQNSPAPEDGLMDDEAPSKYATGEALTITASRSSGLNEQVRSLDACMHPYVYLCTCHDFYMVMEAIYVWEGLSYAGDA
jgi:hypothetical protein